MIDLRNWTQVGATSKWCRIFPGDVLVVLWYVAASNRLYAHSYQDSGVKAITDDWCGKTRSEVQEVLDRMFDPQPEFCDRADFGTFYRHGKRAAWVRNAHGKYWSAADERQNFIEGVAAVSREQAESAARNYVLGKS